MNLDSALLYMFFVLSTGFYSHANNLQCEASYAVGLAHVIKGESAGIMRFSETKTAKDDWHHISIEKEGFIFKDWFATVTDLKNGDKIRLELKKIQIHYINYIAVKNHPENVPGKQIYPRVYLFIMCS